MYHYHASVSFIHEKESYTVAPDNGFTCPVCKKSLKTTSTSKTHLTTGQHGVQEAKAVDAENEEHSGSNDVYDEDGVSIDVNEVNDDEIADDIIVIKEISNSPNIPNSTQGHVPHSSEDALVFASNTQNETTATKIKNQIVLESLQLQPFALAHQEEIAMIVKENSTICRAIAPSKRPLHEDETTCTCSSSQTANPQPLVNLLYNSPYKSMLLKSTFVELNEEFIEAMNKDWSIHP